MRERKKNFALQFIKKNNILLPFEVTAEEMELLYDKLKEDFLLFGYSLDFYKSWHIFGSFRPFCTGAKF